MILKPALKNGQKIIHDATSKTSSAEPQQQQQRKGERSSHAQDVAKNGTGGYYQPASHGVANGHVQNGRSNLSNGSNGLAHAPQNGTHGRLNGNGAKPGPAANGSAASVRPQSYNGVNSSAGGKPVGKPANHGPSVGNVASGDGKQPVAGPRVQAAAGGGRGRDAGAAGGSYPNGGAAATDSAVGAGAPGDSAVGGRARDARRRGGRGRGGAAGSDGVPVGDDIPACGVGAPGAGGSGGGAPERQQDRPGRPRGDRRPRGGPQEAATANGVAVVNASDPVATNSVRTTGEHEDAERGGQRGGRPRGRRGRGGQQAGQAIEGADAQQGDETQRAVSSSQLASDGTEQEKRPRPSRQRPPRETKVARQPSHSGLPETIGRETSQAAVAVDGQPEPARQPRKGREPRQAMEQSGQVHKPRPQDAEGGERDGQEGGRAGGRGRGGRRRNGGGSDGGGAGGEAASGGGAAAAQQADGEGPAGGRRQRPPRPPRQQQVAQQMQLQQPSDDQPRVVPTQQQQAVEQSPAAPASHLHYETPGTPAQQAQVAQPVQVVPHQGLDPAAQGGATHMPPPAQLQAPTMLQQPQYPPQGFHDGQQQLLDFAQQHLIQHMLPQHQYPPQLPPSEFQQQFLQQQQFEPAFPQFQQQMLQQHMAPPPSSGGPHGYMHGPYSAPGGAMGGPGPMPPPPAFFSPGANAYGQMLAPPHNFGGAPVPAGPPHLPPQDFLSGMQQQHIMQQHQLPDGRYHVPEPVIQQQEQQPSFTAVEEPKPTAPEAAVAVSVPMEPEAPAPAAAARQPEAPAAEPVKNEWADRLAQQALARMNAVKSSLITGASSMTQGLRTVSPAEEQPRSSLLARPATYSSGASYGTGSSVPPRGVSSPTGSGSYANEPESWRGYGDTDSIARRSGAPTSNTAPTGDAIGNGNGWRSSLAPTGAADAADAWRLRSGPSDDPVETQAPTAPYQPPRREESPPPPSGATGTAAGRPRLNLQPRTKPLPPSLGSSPAANGDASGAGSASTVATAAPVGAAAAALSGARSSIFGAARPREEVLRERGVAEPERLTSHNVAYANNGSGGAAVARGGRPGSITSGASDEDQWQTVGKGGRSKPPPSSSDVGNALLDAASDPFFTGRTTTGHGVAIVGRTIPSGRVYGSGQYGSYGKGSYGSHGAGGGDGYMNAYGASRGYGNSYGHDNDDDGPLIKRGLPTRNVGPF